MPNEDEFINAMKRLNVKLSDTVVCYDGGATNFFGYRAAWMLQAMGHPAAFVLDGGFAAWVREGKAVEATDATACAEDFAYKTNSSKILHFEQI